MTKQAGVKEKILVCSQSAMVARGICLALSTDFDVCGWDVEITPTMEELKHVDLLIMDFPVGVEGLRQSCDAIKKSGAPPILWVISENDQKPGGTHLLKPFDREKLLEAVCKLLKITRKKLEERRGPSKPEWTVEEGEKKANEDEDDTGQIV